MTIYIVQETLYKNRDGDLIPKFDYDSAYDFDDKLVFLVSPSAKPWNSEKLVEQMSEKLLNFSDDDFLLMSGNPILIGLAATIAAAMNEGRVRYLQWSGVHKEYFEIKTSVGSALQTEFDTYTEQTVEETEEQKMPIVSKDALIIVERKPIHVRLLVEMMKDSIQNSYDQKYFYSINRSEFYVDGRKISHEELILEFGDEKLPAKLEEQALEQILT